MAPIFASVGMLWGRSAQYESMRTVSLQDSCKSHLADLRQFPWVIRKNTSA